VFVPFWMYKEIEYMAISEHESNRLTLEANERFLRSGGEIKDVFGKLDR
jgi:hypothetical protein